MRRLASVLIPKLIVAITCRRPIWARRSLSYTRLARSIGESPRPTWPKRRGRPHAQSAVHAPRRIVLKASSTLARLGRGGIDLDAVTDTPCAKLAGHTLQIAVHVGKEDGRPRNQPAIEPLFRILHRDRRSDHVLERNAR